MWDAVTPSSGFRCQGWEWGELRSALQILLPGRPERQARHKLEIKREVQPPGAVRGPDGPSTSTLAILRLDSWRSTGNGKEYLLLL